MKLALRLGATAALALSLAACADEPPASTVATLPATGAVAAATPLFASYAAADALLRNAGPLQELQRPVVVATLVDVNDLERSTGFGRITAEQVGARLANTGIPVAEVKLRRSILIDKGGEMVLSRDVRQLLRARDAQALVAGTYAVGRDTVFVNLRMLSAADGRVLSAHDYIVPITRDVAALLQSDLHRVLGYLGDEFVVY